MREQIVVEGIQAINQHIALGWQVDQLNTEIAIRQVYGFQGVRMSDSTLVYNVAVMSREVLGDDQGN